MIVHVLVPDKFGLPFIQFINKEFDPKEHIFLIDVQGNLMMRFPKEPDPYKVKKDLMTLLKAATVR